MGSKLIETEITGSLPSLKEMGEIMPQVAGHILGYVGWRSAVQLYKERFDAEKKGWLQYHPRSISKGIPYSNKGNRLVSFSVSTKKGEVRISSFPNNLWENPHKLRSGATIGGTHAMRDGKSSLRFQQYAAEALKNLLDGESLGLGDK
jgi:hypothetical protein